MLGHKTYGRNDDAPSVSIKADWGQGINTVLPADRLPPMQFSGGINLSLREGYPVTRPGVGRARWLYSQTAALGTVFQGGGLIQSADPDPVTKLPTSCLVVVDNNLWICCPNTEPILLKEDVTDALQPVEIIDAFDEALILRGTSQTPLRYRFEAGHFPRELPTARSGQTVLPNAETGCYAGNRVWLKLGKNEVVASDIFEWDYNTTETRYQIDDGENDEIMRLWPVGEDRIVVFKTRSVHVIEGVASLDTTSDPSIQITVRRVAAARGCVARRGIDQRGQTLFYLGRDGLEALELSDNAVAAMSDKPLSIAAQSYWNTLRWLSIEGAQMAIADQYLMISVPTRWREDEFVPDLLLGGGFNVETTDLLPGAAEMSMTAYDPTIDAFVADELTNYIEMPFLFWTRSLETGVGDMLFRGLIRFWESGTVEIDGEANTSQLTDYTWSAGIGTGPTTTSPQTIAVIPYGGNANVNLGTFVPVYWAYSVPSGDFVHFRAGGTSGWGDQIQFLEYPTGWRFGTLGRVVGGQGGNIDLNIQRSGNDLTMQGQATANPAVACEAGINSWELDSSTWTRSNFISHGFGNVSSGTTINYGPYSRTIPNSSTTGLMFWFSLGESGVTNGSVFFGPIFRTAYDPIVVQGIDPGA